MAGLVLVLLASASIALGSPLCCIVATGCCGSQATAAPAEKHDCCSHGKKESAPKPGQEKKDCKCRHDVATHGAAAEHMTQVAVLGSATVVLPGLAVADTAADPSHTAPASHAPLSHPLLL